jgi:hypothetical protein
MEWLQDVMGYRKNKERSKERSKYVKLMRLMLNQKIQLIL